ncbi:ATP-binding protein [Seonamhaeicola sp. MEBiC1930]|uniref:sensor histidine kinase n=1 Tax=Seonamhaeicola sp. MEBiC01930 TaxID=2976768 RepID=UPI003248AA4A
MKKSYFHKGIFLLLILGIGCTLKLNAQVDTLFIDSSFTATNLKPFSKVNKGKTKQFVDNKSYYYFSFNNEYNSIDFTIKNNLSQSKKVILEFSNALIKEIVFSKINNKVSTELFTTGIDYPVSTKAISQRLFSFPIDLKPNELASFSVKLKKEMGKPLVTSVFIKSENTFNHHNLIQQIAIGTYFGVSFLSVAFCFFIFFFLKKSSYLIYAAYIIFLGLFISSYTGLFSQILLPQHAIFNKFTNYVLYSEISLILFVLFSQKILETKTYMPKLKRVMDILLVSIVLIRTLLHFLFTNVFERYVPFFMNLWYGAFLIMLIVIIIQITIYYRENNKRTSFFALAYLFMILGVLATILYHSYGLINTYFYGLPLLFYTSFLEIIFLTFTVVFMVKEVYDERDVLSDKLVYQEKKNLTAFIKGEDQERKRISKELHDNIGSQLSYLKRFVSDKFKDEKVNKTIDTICDDVRNLSHEISPSDLKIVGLESAIEELSRNLSNQTTIKVDFNSYQFPENIDETSSVQLYRIVQEAFNNILKHADANFIDVQLMGHDNSITINIEDDGLGYDSNTEKNGLGLKNMHSRIKQIGGYISIDSKINQGTSILISLPIN